MTRRSDVAAAEKKVCDRLVRPHDRVDSGKEIVHCLSRTRFLLDGCGEDGASAEVLECRVRSENGSGFMQIRIPETVIVFSDEERFSVEPSRKESAEVIRRFGDGAFRGDMGA